MVYMHGLYGLYVYKVLYADKPFDIFYISSLLFGTCAHYSLAFDIHCVYYLFKGETVRQGKKCSQCQQRYLSHVHGIVLVSQIVN